VVLVSGTGSLLQALLDASDDPGYGVEVVAVGSDRSGIAGLARAERRGVPHFVERVRDYADRQDWDAALTAQVAKFEPDLVISAGFLKLVGKSFLAAFGGRFINTHPSLLPAFPGAHAVHSALSYGVTVTGASVFFVDEGTDTGPIISQGVVPVHLDDTEAQLHERIKETERAMLVDVVGRLARHGWTITGRKVTLQ
jgi:phosphoribosylglycinamide formyltransferase-1